MKNLNNLTLMAQQPFSTKIHQRFRPPTAKEMKEALLFRVLGWSLICLGLAGFSFVVIGTFSAHNVSFPYVFSGSKIALSPQESLRMISAICMPLICTVFAMHFFTLSRITTIAHKTWQRDRFIDCNFSPTADFGTEFKEAAMGLYDGIQQLDSSDIITLKNTDGIQDWAKCIVKAELERRNLECGVG